jgi:Zn-dependent oligopeptidase
LRLGSTQQSSAGDNPLLASNWRLKLGQLPLWDKIQPQHIQPAVETLIEQETASLEFLEQDLLAGSGQLSFDRVFKPLTQIQLRTDFVSGQFSHLSVSCYVISARWLDSASSCQFDVASAAVMMLNLQCCPTLSAS